MTEGQSSALCAFMCVQKKYKLHDAGILCPDDRISSSWAALGSCGLYEQTQDHKRVMGQHGDAVLAKDEEVLLGFENALGLL